MFLYTTLFEIASAALRRIGKSRLSFAVLFAGPAALAVIHKVSAVLFRCITQIKSYRIAKRLSQMQSLRRPLNFDKGDRRIWQKKGVYVKKDKKHTFYACAY